MKIPQAFHREFTRWRGTFADARKRATAEGGDVFDLRPSIGEFRRLYERWHPRLLRFPHALRALENMESVLSGTLERAFTLQLLDVVRACLALRAAEVCVAATMETLDAMQGATEEELIEHRRQQREALGEEIDADRDLAKAEEDVYEGEQLMADRLSVLAAAWPDRVNAALRERLDRLDVKSAEQWAKKLSEHADALNGGPAQAVSSEPTEP